MNTALIFSVISLVCCLFFFWYTRRYIKRHTSAEKILAEYRTEVFRLIAEIDTATDRDALLVEERIKTLKALLEDTDKRIAVYVRELERSRTGEALYASLGRNAVRPVQAPAAPDSPPPDSAPKAPRTRRGKKRNQPVPAESAAVSAAPPDQAPPAPAAQQRLRSQITDLAAQGLASVEIASRLNISLDEVDLALNLLNR